MQDIWGQSKNTSNLVGAVGLLLRIFTLTPNIRVFRKLCGLAKQTIFRHNPIFKTSEKLCLKKIK